MRYSYDARVLGIALAGSLVACAGRVSETTVRAAVARTNAALDSAFRRGDANAAAALFDEDAVLSLEFVPDWRGRGVVRTSLAQFFSSNIVTAYTLSPDELEVYGDFAYERGTFMWAARPKGQTPGAPRQLRYAAVRRRGPDGVWRIHRYLENSTALPPR